MQKETERKPYAIRNLAELKRLIVPGTEMKTLSHAYHPDMVGLTRVVNEVHTNCFYSSIKDQPCHRWSVCNNGKGFRTDFEKAGDYLFEGNCIKLLNNRAKDGSVLMEFEVYPHEPQQIQETKYQSRDDKNIAAFLHVLDTEVFPKIDYEKYLHACQTHDLEYPTELLKMFHEAFVQIYGDDLLTGRDAEWIILPAVLQSEKTGDILVGLVELDLSSSGEHWGTNFLTPYGMFSFEEDRVGRLPKYMKENFIPYDYYYTPEILGDIHTDKNNAPDEIKTMLMNATGETYGMVPGM